MEDTPQRPRSKTDSPPSWSDLARSLHHALGLRIELFSIELEEAARLAGKTLGLLLAGLGAIALTYLSLLGLLGAALHRWARWDWFWIFLLFTGLHLAIALFAGRAISRLRGQTSFSETRQQWNRDRQWLEEIKNQPK